MKRSIHYIVLLGVILFMSITVSKGQFTLYNMGQKLYIGEETSLYIKGNLVNEIKDDTVAALIINGELNVSGNLTNTSSRFLETSTEGKVILSGNSASTIESTIPITLHDLEVNKSSGDVTFNNTELNIDSVITLTNGSVQLQSTDLNLIGEAYISGENNGTEFIYNTNSKITDQNINTGTSFSRYGNIGVYFDADQTTLANVTRYNQVTEAGGGSIDLLFKVELANTTAGTVAINYREALFDPSFYLDHKIYMSTDSIVWRKLELSNLFHTSANQESRTQTPAFQTAWFTIARRVCVLYPDLNITQSQPLCDGKETQLLATPLEGEITWNDTLINSDITINDAGNYEVTKILDNGCDRSRNITVTSGGQPTASIGGGGFVCEDSTFSFLNESIITKNVIDNYEWEFIADAVSTTRSGETVTTPGFNVGSYEVRLIASTNFGCADTSDLKEFAVLDLPEISTDLVADYCQFQLVELNDQSTIPLAVLGYPDAIAKREWTIDGTTSQGAQGAINSQNLSTIPVTLEVTTARNCRSSLDTSITIRPVPQASFEVNDTCQGTELTISSVDPSTGVGYNWYITDSLVATNATPIIFAKDTGGTNLTLQVENTFGCQDTVVQTFWGQEAPYVEFSLTDTCQGLPIRIKNNSSISAIGLNYIWSANGNPFSIEEEPSLTIDTAGQVAISLEAESVNGCVAKETIVYTSQEIPQASFVVDSVCAGNSTNYINQTIATQAPSYQMIFDTKDTTNTFESAYLFDESGIKTTTLIAQSLEGCADTVQVIHEVFNNPDFDIADATTCIDSLEIVSPIQSNHFTYLWSTGSTQEAIVIKTDGSYDLSITDSNNCVTARDFEVVLNQTSSAITIIPDTLVCDSLMINAERFNSTYLWSTGETTPSIQIKEDTTVYIQIIDAFNCEFLDTMSIQVDSTPQILPLSDLRACEGDTVHLIANRNYGLVSWSTGAITDTIEVTTTDDIELTVVSTTGNCITRDSAKITYFDYPQSTLPKDTLVCDEIEFTSDDQADVSRWQNTTEDTLSIQEDSLQILTSTNGGTCTTIDTISVVVKTTPLPLQQTTFEACEGNQIRVDLGEAENYSWSTGETSQEQTFLTNDTLTATRSNEICTTTDTIKIRFFTLPVLDLGEDAVYCANDQASLTFNVPGFTNQWFSTSEGLISDSIALPVTRTDTFWLKSTDGGICEVNDTISITILDDVKAGFLSTSIAEIEDTLNFVTATESVGDTYFWDFGNGFTSTEKHPSNQYFFPAEYEVTQVVQLGSCADTLKQILEIYPSGEAPVDVYLKEITQAILENTDAFPNPFGDVLNVLVNLSQEGEVTLYLFNADGEEVFQKTYTAENLETEIVTSDLVAGSYTLFVLGGKQKVAINLVKDQ